MKKILLLFITTSFVLSQNLIWSVDKKYENGNIKAISYHQKVWQKIELVKKETYYENGQIESEAHFKDGKEDGKYVEYYENGQINEEVNFKDGKPDGGGRRYYKNGTIKEEAHFKDGEEDGKWAYYNEDGSIQKVEEWKDGELVE